MSKPLKIGKSRYVGVMCGERVFSVRSWRRYKLLEYYAPTIYSHASFSIGPILFWRDSSDLHTRKRRQTMTDSITHHRVYFIGGPLSDRVLAIPVDEHTITLYGRRNARRLDPDVTVISAMDAEKYREAVRTAQAEAPEAEDSSDEKLAKAFRANQRRIYRTYVGTYSQVGMIDYKGETLIVFGFGEWKEEELYNV